VVSSVARQGRVLVTGASGFLGRWVAFLAAQVWEVLGTFYQHPVAVPRVTLTPLDICDPSAVDALVTRWRPEVVIHTAVYIGEPARMYQVIVEGTVHLLRSAAKVGAFFVYVSTDLVFDGEHAPYTEAAMPRPILPYGRMKWEAERAVMAYPGRTLVVRPSLLCHLNPPDPRTRRVLDAAYGKIEARFFVDEFRTPAWVTDVARTLVELVDRRASGLFHLGGPQRLSRYDLAVKLARALGAPTTRLQPGYREESGLIRPRDTSLDSSKACRLLRARLHSIDEGADREDVGRWADPVIRRQAPEPGDPGAWHTTPGGERST